MLLIIITILAIALVLYALLGGADFGAGIVETFAGRKGEKIVSRAMAPVWEANHVWLILIIVILFTAFPRVYSTVSTALHIPLMIVLLGIVLRGSSFTFRYYDIEHDALHKYYTFFFKSASFITPLFLGVTLGAMILGEIDLSTDGSFYERFIHPWLNLFCFSVGLFSTALFGYTAAVFLIGEAPDRHERRRYIRIAQIFFLLVILMGMLVFAAAEWQSHHLVSEFFAAPVSIICFCLMLLFIPMIMYFLHHPGILYLRLAVGMQITLILLGWFAIQYPRLVYVKNGEHLTFYNTQAPPATLQQLLIALFTGLALVLPAFYFLFKVFKKVTDPESNEELKV